MLLQRFVLWSQRFAPLHQLYRLYYRLALALFRLACRRFPEIQSIRLRRGMTREGWVPGSSDIDLRVLFRADGDGEEPFLRAFWRQYAALKRVFPFFGEVQVLDVRHAPCVDSWSGLHDRLRAEGALKARWQALGEALQSCLAVLEQTLLGSAGRRGDPAYPYKIAKGYLEVVRLSAIAGTIRPPTRADIRKSLDHMGMSMAFRDPYGIDERTAADLAYDAIAWLDAACRLFVAELEPASPVRFPTDRAGPWPYHPNSDLRRFRDRLSVLEDKAFPRVRGFYFDARSRWYVVADTADRISLLRLFGKLSERHRTDPMFQAPPWVLSPAMFQVLLWTSHLETPFFGLALNPSVSMIDVAVRRSSRFPLLNWAKRVQWRMLQEDFLAPPDSVLRWSFEQCVCDLTLALRLYGLKGWAGDNTYRVVHLYSRLLNARLFQASGSACDPHDIDAIIDAFAQALPEEFSAVQGPLLGVLARYREDCNADEPESCFYRHLPAWRALLDRLVLGGPPAGPRAGSADVRLAAHPAMALSDP